MTLPLAAIACGFATGLGVGSASVLMVQASDAWVRGWAWPAVDSRLFLLLLVTSVPAGINGAIGAGLAARGRCRRLDVTWVPVSLHVAAAAVALDDLPYLFLGYQLFALAFTVVVWPAGRLGQLVGSAFFRRGAADSFLRRS